VQFFLLADAMSRLVPKDANFMKRTLGRKKATTSLSMPPRPVILTSKSMAKPTPDVEALTLVLWVGTPDPHEWSRHGDASSPLVSSLLGEDIRLGDKVSYHLRFDVKDLVKGIFRADALRTTNELSLHLAVLTSRFPMVDQSQIDALQKRLAISREELKEMLTSVANMSKHFS